MRPLVRFVVLLGAAAGLGEVALRSSPIRGLGPIESVIWAGASVLAALALGVVALGVALALARAFPARVQTRVPELTLGLFAGVHAAINYRYEWVLNHFVRDPAVWLGMPLVGLLAWGVVTALSAMIGVGPRTLAAVAVASAVAIPIRTFAPRGAALPKPNVLVVSLDTVRADFMADKPTFSKLAREGTVFTQAIAAAPITEPSHLAMFTGIAPFRSGIVTNGTPLGDRPALVWRDFADAGYMTAGFVAGFPLHGKYGWSQGMSVWDDDFGRVAGFESLSLIKLYNQFFVKEHALRERSAALVLSRAERWIADHVDESTFTFVHFYDAHGPYTSASNATLGQPRGGPAIPLPEYWPASHRAITDAEWLTRAYNEEISDVDRAVDRLLSAYGTKLDNTIVVVTADHGESLTEHGYWFDHGENLHDPSLRVPLVVRFPPAVLAGQTVTCQVGGVDLAPTLLGLAGIADTMPRDGISRVQELAGGECRRAAVVASTTRGRFVETPSVDHALRSEQQKLVRKGEESVELYDLSTDPGELRNLAPAPESDVAMQLLQSMLAQGTGAIVPEMDAETRAVLEQLGYLEPSDRP